MKRPGNTLTDHVMFDKLDGHCRAIHQTIALVMKHASGSAIDPDVLAGGIAALWDAYRLLASARETLPTIPSRPDPPDAPIYPDNRGQRPIRKLIEHLRSLPPGTTYTEYEGQFYGGQCINPVNGMRLGTSYQVRYDIVEGWRDES